MSFLAGFDPTELLQRAGSALERAAPALAAVLPTLALRARARQAGGGIALVGEAGDAGPARRVLEAAGPGAGVLGLFPPDEAGCAALVAAAAARAPSALDRVLLVLPGADGATLARLARPLRVLDVEISVLGGAPVAAPGARIAGLPVRVLSPRALPAWGRAVKRAGDVAAALALLAAFAPMLVYVGLAVWLQDGGPPLFRQAREGRNGARFTVLKFRTMRIEPEPDAAPFRQTGRGDERVTRLGRFLRRTSIDELPQLFNVLRGEMSLIGPRPHVPGLLAAERRAASLERDYARRHRVKPGLSGWAQIHHSRGALDGAAALSRRLALDLHYIDHWSPALDLKVALLTPVRLLFPRGGAY